MHLLCVEVTQCSYCLYILCTIVSADKRIIINKQSSFWYLDKAHSMVDYISMVLSNTNFRISRYICIVVLLYAIRISGCCVTKILLSSKCEVADGQSVDISDFYY